MIKGICHLVIVTAFLISCGSARKYPDYYQSAFSTTLSAQEKNEINESGEIIRRAEFGGSTTDLLLKGTYRIIKTRDPGVFNFVEIGKWIRHSKSSGKLLSIPITARDTTTYDTLGNALRKKTYNLDIDGFKKVEEWTSTLEDGAFIQHVRVFKQDTLITEYSQKVVDYAQPKSDALKRKVKAGTERVYRSDGTLNYERNYDERGRLIPEKKEEALGKHIASGEIGYQDLIAIK